MKIRGRVDGNQKEVVTELRDMGFSVAITSQLGNGFPDIVLGYQNHNYLFEIKDPSQSPSARVLTLSEERFRDNWKGNYNIILSAQDALRYIYSTKCYNRR